RRTRTVPEIRSTPLPPPGQLCPKCPLLFKLVISSLPYELMAYTLARCPALTPQASTRSSIPTMGGEPQSLSTLVGNQTEMTIPLFVHVPAGYPSTTPAKLKDNRPARGRIAVSSSPFVDRKSTRLNSSHVSLKYAV